MLDTVSVVAVRYDSDQRHVAPQQERVRFQVTHDAQRPFIVPTGASEVLAHGTVFDVDLRAPHVRVALLEETVEVRQPVGVHAPSKSTTLRPGQQLAFGDARVGAAPVAIRIAETRWPSGMLSFEDVPLAEVVASANRYSPTHIVIDDRAVEERRVAGTFKAGQPAKLAAMIGSMFDLSVRSNLDGNLVLAAATK